jgi:heme O synthase-like polyprenyltransferase
MATELLLVAYGLPVVQPRHFVRSNVLSNYWTLTKPEINFLIGLATAAAFFVGCAEPLARFPWVLLVHTLLGTDLVASGAGTLN